MTSEQFFESAADWWETYVLRDGATAVATGAVEERHPGIMRIGRVLVDPTRRGQGLGRRMMELLVDYAAARPEINSVTLSVFEKNHAARALYKTLGFVDTGDRIAVHVQDDVLTGLEMIHHL